jgi:hypothetical protein
MGGGKGKGIMGKLRRNKAEKYQVEEQAPDDPLRQFFLQVRLSLVPCMRPQSIHQALAQVEKMDGQISSLNDQLAEIDSIQSQILSCPRNNKGPAIYIPNAD